MTIGKKLGFCTGGLVALCVLVGVASWVTVSALGNSVDEIVNVTTQKIALFGQMKTDISTFGLYQRGMVMFALGNDPAQVERSAGLCDAAIGKAEERLRQIRPLLTTPKGKEVFSKLETGVAEYKNHFAKLRSLAAAGKLQESIAYDRENLTPLGGRLMATVDELNGLAHAVNKQAAEAASANRSRAISIVVIGLILCLPAAVVATVVTRRATRQMRQTAEALEGAAAQVTSAASQVAVSSQALAQGASEQAASLEQTSSSTEEISSMTLENSTRASKAAELTEGAGRQFVGANQRLGEMVTAMQEISSASDQVAKIIKVIDEIAFQTNILALNAAVEAARAGEAGMGFAVVADEVRNLAQRCAQAANDTQVLIESAISKSAQGSQKVREVEQAISSITKQAADVKILVDEVSVGSQQQKDGLEQIAKAISQMEQVTQRTAASAEESASAGEELNSQAESLRSLVGQLTRLVDGADKLRASAGIAAAPAPSAVSAARPLTPSKARAMAPPKISDDDWMDDKAPSGN